MYETLGLSFVYANVNAIVVGRISMVYHINSSSKNDKRINLRWNGLFTLLELWLNFEISVKAQHHSSVVSRNLSAELVLVHSYADFCSLPEETTHWYYLQNLFCFGEYLKCVLLDKSLLILRATEIFEVKMNLLFKNIDRHNINNKISMLHSTTSHKPASKLIKLINS